ncbi:hypothetical protein FRB98_005044 [Tulasnella sp. 332]|nr:hypothetical protein FRB98_005044 [Tulasnella sp. 332]
MHFSFGRRTVAGGDDERVKKFPRLLSLFRRKSKKNRSEYVPTAPSHPGDTPNKQTFSIPSRNEHTKASSNVARRHSPAQLTSQTPVVDFPEADFYFRSSGSDSNLELALEDGCYGRPSCCPGIYEDGRESEETPTSKTLTSLEITSTISKVTSPLSVGQIVSYNSCEPVLFSTAASLSLPAAFSFTKIFARPSQRVTFSMEPIPEEIESEEISTHDTPELEFADEDGCFNRPSCFPGFFEEECEFEETPTFEAFNSSKITSATDAVISPPSVGQVAPHEQIPNYAAPPFSPAARFFTKTFALPSKGMTFSMEPIPEEREAEDTSSRDTPCATLSSTLKHLSADAVTMPTSFMRSMPSQSSCQSELPMLHPETPFSDFPSSGESLSDSSAPLNRRILITDAEDQKETATLDCKPRGLGLFLPSAATLCTLPPYPPLESVTGYQLARSLSPVTESLNSSPGLPRPSLSSSASPLPSATFDSSSLPKETTSISPATSFNEQQRSGSSSSGSDRSSKDCLKDVDRWSLELKVLQETFQSLTPTTPMEALLGALFPEDYPHLAPTSPSFPSNSGATHVDTLCESSPPTPSSAYFLPEPLASSPSVSYMDSDNLSEENIETPSASDWQDHWRSRVSICDIRELARRENERLERLGPQHSIAEELRLLDIVELSLHAL